MSFPASRDPFEGLMLVPLDNILGFIPPSLSSLDPLGAMGRDIAYVCFSPFSNEKKEKGSGRAAAWGLLQAI